jgi:hypothetical protein
MSDKKLPVGSQIDVITPFSFTVQESFDLKRLDVFSTSLGVEYIHYKSMPSPIGKKDRGDYRRSDGVDTITSNGLIYKCAGRFTATMTDNSHQANRGDSGILDFSEARLVLPRFYTVPGSVGDSNGARIYLSPGDRIYVADPMTDVRVSNPQQMDYEPGIDNVPMFPIVCLELPIIDSRNYEYIENTDYAITAEGNIRWLPNGANPGIDPTTGKGRIYSIRYLYRAYWYITALPKEVRVTKVTTNGVRSPERMPYHAIVVREFVFHNQNRGDSLNQLKSKEPARADTEPVQSITPNKYFIPVDMSTIRKVEDGSDEEQS